jgi:hypothetical protein
VAGKFELKRAPRMAPGLWITPQVVAARRQWRFAEATRAFLALLIVLCLGIAGGVRSTVIWMRRVAIPAVRESGPARAMRRRLPEIVLYGGLAAVAVAVGWLIAGM